MKTIKRLLWRNKKTVLAVVLLVGMYFAKRIPGLGAEQELLDQLWALLVLGSVAIVPSFRMKERQRTEDTPKDPPA
jgi:hypothetical protein